MSPLSRDPTFRPLFLTQWLGAFNDNALKSAFSFLIAFEGLTVLGLSKELALMAGALVQVLPFVIFSGFSGRLSDRINKAVIVRRTRLLEIPLALLVAVGLLLKSGPLLLACLCAYSIQSAFFGPAKYSILPQMLPRDKLINANALFESSTFVAILCGLLFGGFMAGNGLVGPLSIVLIVSSLASFLIARQLPDIPAVNPDTSGGFALIGASRRALRAVFEDRSLTRAAVGIAWFWAIGLVVTSVFPKVARDDLGLSANAANALIGCFVLGIGFGTFVIARLLKGEISARHVPLGALGLAVFLLDFSFAVASCPSSVGSETGITSFVATFEGARIVFDMIAIAFFGGVYTVPIYAILQSRAGLEIRSTTVAGSNILNATTMLSVSVLATGLFSVGLSFPVVVSLFAGLTVLVGLYLSLLSPASRLSHFMSRSP